MVNRAQRNAARLQNVKKAKLFKSPDYKPIKTMAIIDVQVNNGLLSLSHVDTATNRAAHPSDPTFPSSQTDNAFTMAEVMWGCKQFAQLYQFFKIHKLTYQYIPTVAYTWTGTVAVRIVDDPTDATSTTAINEFVNAPSSMIAPVYAPSSVMTWVPSSGRKYCYSTTTFTQNLTYENTATGSFEFNQQRHESFGKLVFRGFDIKDASGADPAGTTTLGRLVVQMDISYQSPVPINQTTMESRSIYLPDVVGPAP